MKVTALQPAIICFFSVLIQIQSDEIEYVFNYEDFSEIFEQGGLHNFNVAKYEDIDEIFDKPYEGSNIGGAFLLYGRWLTGSWHEKEFDGYLTKITTTHYCGNLSEPNIWNPKIMLWINYVDGSQESKEICSDALGWNYNYVWIPQRPTRDFTFGLEGKDATVNKPLGFDEIRITTSTTPPQLLKTLQQLQKSPLETTLKTP